MEKHYDFLPVTDVMKKNGHPCTGTEALYSPYDP